MEGVFLSLLVVLISLQLTCGLEVELEIEPESDEDETSSFSFQCFVSDNDEDLEISSITLSRRAANGAELIPIAGISSSSPDEPVIGPGVRNIKVEGDIDADEETYLKVILSELTVKDLGLYVCEVLGQEDEDEKYQLFTAEARLVANTETFKTPQKTSPRETSTPVATTTVLVEETTIPLVKTTTRVTETKTPVVVTTTPVAETTTPVVVTATPVAETTTPVVVTTTPVAETTTPVIVTTTPVAETTTPIVETTTSAAETTTPIVETTIPVAETTSPKADTTTQTVTTTPALPDTTLTEEKTTSDETTSVPAETTVPEEVSSSTELTTPIGENITLTSDATIEEKLATLVSALKLLDTRVAAFNSMVVEIANQLQTLDSTGDDEEDNKSSESDEVDVIDNYFVYENASYYFFKSNDATDVNRAQVACESRRFYLTEVNDAGELQAIAEEISPRVIPEGLVLVAGQKQADQDVWLYQGSRQQVDFFSWAPGQPLIPSSENECLALRPSEGGVQMVSIPCTTDQKNFYFLCEHDD